MTVYAPVPAYADRKRHPHALFLIVTAHAVLLAAVITARMELPAPFDPTKTEIELVPLPPEPTPNPPSQELQQKSAIARTPQIVPIPQPDAPSFETVLPLPQPEPGPAIGPEPAIEPKTIPVPVRTGPRFATPDSKLKPPYPIEKRRLEEETVLRLKLTIDERGRVTAVDPVGRADPVFLASARRHLIANWRYRPATEDGRPISSSTVVTLTFRLED